MMQTLSNLAPYFAPFFGHPKKVQSMMLHWRKFAPFLCKMMFWDNIEDNKKNGAKQGARLDGAKWCFRISLEMGANFLQPSTILCTFFWYKKVFWYNIRRWLKNSSKYSTRLERVCTIFVQNGVLGQHQRLPKIWFKFSPTQHHFLCKMMFWIVLEMAKK